MGERYHVELDRFACTRSVLRALEGWVNTLARHLPPPVQKPSPDGSFRWRFAEETPRVLLVGKSVRMASAIVAAMELTDLHFLVEGASLLRMVSDYSSEILSVSRGVIKGALTTDERRYVEEYFAAFPETTEEFRAIGKRRFVSREDLLKSQRRMVQDAGQDADEFAKNRAGLNAAYDAFVHGAYHTAMDMYHGGERRFMTRGHEYEPHVDVTRTAVAGKLHEVLTAVQMIAASFEDVDVYVAIERARLALNRSGEDL